MFAPDNVNVPDPDLVKEVRLLITSDIEELLPSVEIVNALLPPSMVFAMTTSPEVAEEIEGLAAVMLTGPLSVIVPLVALRLPSTSKVVLAVVVKFFPEVKVILAPLTLYKISESLKLPLAVAKALLLKLEEVELAVIVLVVNVSPFELESDPELLGATAITLPLLLAA